jgi:hypothetical protein
MNRWPFLLLAAASFALTQCGSFDGDALVGPIAPVTRSQCLATAERFATHKWTAQPHHVQHGDDSTGIRVDTPDAGFNDLGSTPGWWKVGAVNEGVPYCWGGFDTPKSFDAALRSGKWAGDVYTQRKRSGLESAHSQFAAGADCSGFVSRCWNLEWHCSTRAIPKVCDRLPSYDALQPGDALSTYNGHVVLFAGFTQEDKSEFLVYETGSPLGWRVMQHTTPAWFLRAQGYKPYRYRGMKEG